MCVDFIIADGTQATAVVGRTMEFNADGKPNVQVFQAGQENPIGSTPKTSKIGYLVVTEELPLCPLMQLDGFNAAGLSCDALYFPGLCAYPDKEAALAMKGKGAKAAEAPSFWFGDMVQYILGNCATLEEVKTALAQHAVYSKPCPRAKEILGVFDTAKISWNDVASLHFQVFDKSGNGLVIESEKVNPESFVPAVFEEQKGGGDQAEQEEEEKNEIGPCKLRIYDSIGVMTNSPSYPFHVTNTRQYAALTNELGQRKVATNASQIKVWGQGGQWLGMPGDYTPASRFIRVWMHKLCVEQSEKKPKTKEEAVAAVSHILNSQDLTLGLIKEPFNAETALARFDYTQWVAIKDLVNGKAYFRGYSKLNWLEFDLNEVLGELETGDSKIVYESPKRQRPSTQPQPVEQAAEEPTKPLKVNKRPKDDASDEETNDQQ